MNDQYRPQFHFTPPHGWMNDPNGLVFYEGEWHLFYQYLDPKNWGHAVSRDLVHWEHLPIALEPDEHGAIWSGSAIVDSDDSSGLFDGGSGLVALFTYEKNGTQSQALAFSRDGGRTWTKFEGNPVLTSDNPNFRDPKVFWHGASGRWVMILATGDCVSFYTSHDLKQWVFASTFGEGLLKGVWECPDLFALPVDDDSDRVKWVLQTSWLEGSIFSEGQGDDGLRYFVGHFDGERFTDDNAPDVVLRSGAGRDDYATVSWSDVPHKDGRRVWIGWMSHWVYAGKVPMQSFLGAMTLPRCVQLKTMQRGVRLVQTPVEELKSLRGAVQTWGEQEINEQSAVLAGVKADVFELIAEFDISSAREFGLRLRQSATQHTTVAYNAETNTVFVDRMQSGAVDFSPHFATGCEMPLESRSGLLKLHIFVDVCSIEVFVNDGEAYSANLIFPEQAARGFELYSVGGAVRLKTLELYPLRSASTRSP
jgi:fructan beta-fructosidase